MGLVLKCSVSEKTNYTSLYVYDTTGIYKSTDPNKNLTGWQDASTEFLNTVTNATLTISTPDRITLLPTNNPVIIDVSATIPNIINNPYEVKATDLGFGDGLLPDGWYKIVYTVVANGTTYTYTNNAVLTARVTCCVNKQVADFEACGCNGNSMDKVLWSRLLLHAVKRQIGCDKISKAIDTLKELISICNKQNCYNC